MINNCELCPPVFFTKYLEGIEWFSANLSGLVTTPGYQSIYFSFIHYRTQLHVNPDYINVNAFTIVNTELLGY